MNLAFDAKRFFFNNTGLGNYSRTLVKSLLDSFPSDNYFLISSKKATLGSRFLAYQNLEVYYPAFKLPLWRQFFVGNLLKNRQIDVFHGLSHEIPFGLEKIGIKTVVTMHDLIFERYPHLFKPVDAFLYRKKYKSSAMRADRIIAISQSTKNDLTELYGIDENKIDVVYQTCNEVFMKPPTDEQKQKTKQKFSLPDDYILYVGSIIERKNLLDIFKALKQLPESLKIPIVVVGKGKEYLQKVETYVNENGLAKFFIRLNEVRNEDLPSVYALAKVFVYTSTYEGFGIPVLEALYSGVPVITSNVSSMPEAGGDAAYYVTPGNIDELLSAIEKVLIDNELRNKMIMKGFAYAKKFTTKKMAEEMHKVYEKLFL